MSVSVYILTVCYIYSREFNSLYVPMISSTYRHLAISNRLFLAATYVLFQAIGNQPCIIYIVYCGHTILANLRRSEIGVRVFCLCLCGFKMCGEQRDMFFIHIDHLDNHLFLDAFFFVVAVHHTFSPRVRCTILTL